MKEDWLQKVRDRLTEYEIDEPEDLWEAIESGRTGAAPAPRPARRAAMMVWIKRSIAVAAMVTAAISVNNYFVDIKRDIPDALLLSTVVDKSSLTDNGKVLRQGINGGTAKALIARDITAANIHNTARTERLTEIVESSTANDAPRPEESAGFAVAQGQSEKSDNTHGSNGGAAEMRPASPPGNGHIASMIRPGVSNVNRVSVSIYSSGGTGSASSFNSKGTMFDAGIGPDNSGWKDDPMLGILVFNQGMDIETDIKHRLPIRAGISVTYNFNERLGIESGLSYTRLISDVKDGSKSHYYAGQQKLHYIGVPLNLKYRVYTWRRLDLYISTGMLAEKCVSARLDREFVIDRQKKGSESEVLSDKPLQWSVNASVGAQYRIINSMGVFVEPGMSYYFDDGTNIQTIYKEKPLNFNLNMGIRLTFGR